MLFKIGFIAFNWTDLIDILVCRVLFYKLYMGRCAAPLP